jgi:hypothetical protein
LLDGVAALLHFLLHHADEISVGQLFGLALNQQVADDGFEQPQSGEFIRVFCKHRGFHFLAETFLEGHREGDGRRSRGEVPASRHASIGILIFCLQIF